MRVSLLFYRETRIYLFIERRIKGVKVFRVKIILNDP